MMTASPAHAFALIAPHTDLFIQLRRDIHQQPELAFQEHLTRDLVADKLESWGYTVERGLGGTGVVGQLRRGASPRRLGLRADMDALPIEEATGLDYASRRPGVMHACGHDGHTAMLLCAARALAQSDEFSGTLNLVFQPAEEYGTDDSGAMRMIADGLFEKYPCDAIFAMHNMPGWPQGHLVFREGPMMASSDKVYITLEGTGGHGALPHKAADPVVAAASLVMALQTIVSRNVDPLATAVISVGVLQAGQANNVIPQSARLELSVRTLDSKVRQDVEQRITTLAHAQAEGYGVKATVDYRRGYAVLVNSPAETALARQVGLELVGAGQMTDQGPALTGSEDFAYMLERCPGSYLLIGNGAGEQPGACMVHNPGYDFNDDNIGIGAAYWVHLTQRFLAK
ncbi:M20 aminoacylase family protein [Castellaniella hirudinis]|uniref:M20 aminoacylase family protein n=1 Tax=Castellaniella hirudinis TaxID=1144617 RepID=UPI0039C120E2